MLQTRKTYYDELDRIAEVAATCSLDDAQISEAILRTLGELYVAAKVEKEFENAFFETAYHSPVTSELEFFIARILYHYSVVNDRGWKVLLRRQERKTAPDIRLTKGGITFAVIEIKAKAGWMQGFFSPEKFAKDKAKFDSKEWAFDPGAGNEKSRDQLEKYFSTFGIGPEQVFLLLPTLALVHQKKSKMDLVGYYEYFSQTSGLPSENLVLLSGNMRLDLSYNLGDLLPTGNFERMLGLLDKRTPSGAEILAANHRVVSRSSSQPIVNTSLNKCIDVISEPVIAININQTFRPGMNSGDLYDFTRGIWRLSLRTAGKAKYAFSVYGGVVKEVFEIDQWHPAGTTPYINQRFIDPILKDRFEFVGRVADDNIRDKYIEKTLPKKHGQNPIRYFNC
jgi:hypothetical protein